MKTASSATISTPIDRVWNWDGVSFRASSGRIALGLFLFSLLLRVGDFDAMVNTDMYFIWSARIVRFMDGLASGNLTATYQSHHPGVTLMWLVGLVWRTMGVLKLPIALHPEKVQMAVWPIALVGSLFPALSYPLLLKLLGTRRRFAVFFVALLLATEPLLVAHSRNPHLDILATTFAWFAVFLSLISKRDNSYLSAIAGGVCLGLALLSKISTAGFALGIAAVYLIDCLRFRSTARRRFRQLTTIVVVSLVTVVALWPALWVAPIETLVRLHHGLTHEVEKAIPFMLFERAGTMVVPFWVYGLFVVFLVTPEAWIPGVFGGLFLSKAQLGLRRFLFDLSVVSAPLLFLVMRSNNVGVRNTILFLPLFAILSALVIGEVYEYLSRRSLRWAFVCSLVFLVGVVGGRTMRLISLYPLPITYCSRWTGIECSNVFHVGWGEGMKETAAFIQDYKRVHYSDSKLLSIYGSGYAPIVRVWTDVKVVSKVEDAHLLVDYAPDWQRRGKRATVIASYAEKRNLEPLFEVVLAGRPYVRIYSGPRIDANEASSDLRNER